MITTMRGCVAHNDLWPWPISSRSFGLDLENRVRSVASTVLDGFFLYLAQMITIIRGCVACYVFFRIWKFEFLANFWNFSPLSLKKKSTVLDGFFPYLAQMITNMRGCVAYNDLWGGGYPQNEGVLVVLVCINIYVTVIKLWWSEVEMCAAWCPLTLWAPWNVSDLELCHHWCR